MPVGISRPPPWSTTNAFPTEKGGYVANQLPARKEWGLKRYFRTFVFGVCTTILLIKVLSVRYDPAVSTRAGLTTAKAPFIAKPERPLEWGDVNIIHTTDSHGWLLGHQKSSAPEPNARSAATPLVNPTPQPANTFLSGTFGDLYSFVHHMKKQASALGVDLLVVDSGDLHDGNGLSDGFPPGGVNGHETNKFFARMPYDLLAIGNHELYKYPVALDVHQDFAPKWNGRYLTSNVNITVVSPEGNVQSLPIGERYAKFETTQGRKITAFGVLFGFVNNAANTHVERAEGVVKQPWFQEAIADAPDLFILVGHMAVVESDWPVVFAEIRKLHPTVPIAIFGGHTHIRDCTMLDDRSMALESGRFLETVGWMSIKLSTEPGGPSAFSRRYLDANRVTYQYHSGTTETNFDTTEGLSITNGLQQLAKRFHLDDRYGVVPHDFYLSRVPYPHTESVISLYVEKVLPAVLPTSNPSRAGVPSIIIANTGAQRFDIFKGPFTRNDQFIVSPFTNTFRYVHIPYGLAKHVLDKLNHYGAYASAPSYVDGIYSSWRKAQWEIHQHRRTNNLGSPLTLGYVTDDACPGNGDDTVHAPIPYYDAPDYAAHSNVIKTASNSTGVDVIVLDFFTGELIKAVNDLRAEHGHLSRNVTLEDVGIYGNLKSDEVLSIYAKEVW